MAGKTLINGTSYKISGGKTLINGTGYSIKKGKTLIDGTGYNINFNTLPPIGTPLNDCSWDEISQISASGQAANYWAVGDRKAVYLSGTVGSLSLSGTYYCYIIGIDHNSGKEGTNRIHFQFGKTALSGGKDICFIDSGYNTSKTSGSWFNMNNSNSNSGGWNGSRMRTTIIPSFKNCMPSDLKSVLKSVTKYSDNTGGGSDNASYVTATTEDIFLLAEFEVFGKRSYANSAEKNYQAQYAYYSSGNSKVKYCHSATGTTAGWFLRSVRAGTSDYFCRVASSGSANYYRATDSRGFAPAFCV